MNDVFAVHIPTCCHVCSVVSLTDVTYVSDDREGGMGDIDGRDAHTSHTPMHTPFIKPPSKPTTKTSMFNFNHREEVRRMLEVRAAFWYKFHLQL